MTSSVAPFSNEQLEEELSASVEFGSGYLCVVGPPSSGKTTLLLNYLVKREQQFARSPPVASSSTALSFPKQPAGTTQPEGTFLMEYWTARSFGGDALSQMAHRLQLHSAAAGEGGAVGAVKRRRRLFHDCTPLEFGDCVAQWFEGKALGSELHLVIDDADTLDEGSAVVNTWLSNCLHAKALSGKKLCLWLVSQLPLRIPNCFRFHFISSPSVEAVCSWLQREQRVHRHVLLEEEEAMRLELRSRHGESIADSGDGGEASSSSSGRLAVRQEYMLTAAEAVDCVSKAVHYYSTHQPMCASVVSKDVRLLLRRVYQLLPALVLMAGEVDTTASTPTATTGQGSGIKVNLNAIHFSSAWGRHKDIGGRNGDLVQLKPTLSGSAAAAAADPLVIALKRIGYSAVLLAFSAFFCGAVPRRKQLAVFGAATAAERRTAANADAHAQSHKAAVLSAASQVIALPRLLHVYNAALRMCIEHIDPLEFASAEVAAHYIAGFQAWGLMSPVLGHKHKKRYHCWIPVSTAVHLGEVLSLRLFDLIPS